MGADEEASQLCCALFCGAISGDRGEPHDRARHAWHYHGIRDAEEQGARRVPAWGRGSRGDNQSGGQRDRGSREGRGTRGLRR